MRIIGEKLNNKELLSIKGGLEYCYKCDCGSGTGEWVTSRTTYPLIELVIYCGAGHDGDCTYDDHPECVYLHE